MTDTAIQQAARQAIRQWRGAGSGAGRFLPDLRPNWIHLRGWPGGGCSSDLSYLPGDPPGRPAVPTAVTPAAAFPSTTTWKS